MLLVEGKMRGKIFPVRIIGLLFVSLIFYATIIPGYALGHDHPAHQIIAWKAWFLLPSSDVKTALANYLGAPAEPSNSDYDVIPYYIGKDKNGNPHEVNLPLAFWWLGRVAHLLTDMSVPAHTHNDPHVSYNYEKYINQKACSDDASCAWCPVSDITECGSPVASSDLYDLFWSMAEKADDHDSENREGAVDGGK